MAKETKTSVEEKTDGKESPKIFLVEKIIIGLIIFIVFLTLAEIRNIGFRFFTSNFYGVVDSLIIPVALSIMILMRFSRDIKAKISFIIGVFATLYTIDYFLLYQIFFKLGIGVFTLLIISIIGITYGIIGLKSSSRKLAIFGIILNAPGLFFVFYSIFLCIYFDWCIIS